MNIVLFGDSLTFGYGVYKKDSISSLLQNRFPQDNIINSGINGDTTREAVKRLFDDVLRNEPDIVTILYGSNDCAPSDYGYRTIVEFENNLDIIISRIREISPKTEIIMITPPPVDETVFMPWTTNKRIEPYCQMIKEKAKEYDCIFLDFNKIFSEESKDNLEEYLQEDGCHLSEKGYICFYESLYPIIEKLK